MRPPGRVSLYWSFAGFLFVLLLLATVLQGVVVVTVVHPMMLRAAASRAQLQTISIANQIREQYIAHGEDQLRPAIAHILMKEGGDAISPILVFEHAEGWRVSNRGPGRRRHDRRAEQSSDSRHLLARTEVVAEGTTLGTLSAYSLATRFGGGSHSVRALVFLPVAVLLAGSAAFVMFRALMRRLQRLEDMTVRVSEGDLDARIEDPGADEIGRLGVSLNEMTARLREARDHLDSTDRQRRQLFADITHELATPLTSIRGFAETLSNPDMTLTDDERQRYALYVRDASERMAAMLDELLELSRLEAGATEFQFAPLELGALCSHTLRRFEEAAVRRRLRLAGAGLDRELWVEADGRRLEQVLDNLLANALRYVPEGGSVRLALESREGAACIAVEDDGPGFAPEALPHVFDRFFRADEARSHGGTGLGLAIVREIVRRHGGRTGAANRPAGGARVWVELPRRP